MMYRQVHPRFRLVNACALVSLLACSVKDDDEPPTGESSNGPSDNEICLAALDELSELECTAPFQPQFFQNGDQGTVVLVDDPSVGVSVGGGILVDFGTNADWVGLQITENGNCAVGCFAACGPEHSGCFANTIADNSCFYCEEG